MVQAALVNGDGQSRAVQVALGGYDTTRHIYARQRLTVEAGSVQLISFGPMRRLTARGDMAAANFIFVFPEKKGARPLAAIPIQNRKTGGVYPQLSHYLSWGGDTVRLSMAEPAGSAQRVVFVPRTLEARGNTSTGRPVSGAMMPVSARDIQQLRLPRTVMETYLARLDKEYAFICPAQTGGWIAMDYVMPSVPEYEVMSIPVSRFVVDGAGGGGTISSTVLIVNPQTISFHPLLPLDESETGIWKSGKSPS